MSEAKWLLTEHEIDPKKDYVCFALHRHIYGSRHIFVTRPVDVNGEEAKILIKQWGYVALELPELPPGVVNLFEKVEIDEL